jgi:hypothetical protein
VNTLALVRARWFTTSPVEEAFFDSAPFRLRAEFDIPRSATHVWADLTADSPLFGVGTTRTARSIGAANVLKERFFRWEEGRRQSFYVLEASVPLFRSFAEDYLVEPTSEASCRFTWTIAIDPRPAARVLNPANRLLLGTLFRDTRKHYGLR